MSSDYVDPRRLLEWMFKLIDLDIKDFRLAPGKYKGMPEPNPEEGQFAPAQFDPQGEEEEDYDMPSPASGSDDEEDIDSQGTKDGPNTADGSSSSTAGY